MLAELAMRDGHRVAAFDLFGDLDLRRGGARVVARPGGSLTALVDAAIQAPAGGVVYGASFENHPALVARLGERHTLLGNGPQTLRAVRDPQRLAAALRDAGLAYPRTFAAAPDDRSGRWLRKPLRGGGGTRVRAWRGGTLPAGAVVQERIGGVACSAAAVGDGVEAVVLGLTEQLVGRRAFGVRGYRWCGNVVPPRLPAGEREDLLGQARAICSSLAAAFALRGLFGVDFVWDGERAWTIEVNPRPTASLEAIEAAHAVGVFDAHLRACAGELPRVEVEPTGAAGKAVLFATADVVVGDSVGWLQRGVRDVPHPGERIAAGHPICTLVAVAPTAQDALDELEEQAARLRSELEPRVEVTAGG
ncbi:MAG TPA: ATP-grasp domain-containing protein [Solirubrobacteraceae bacterium]